MLLAGIGEPYDVTTGKGAIGRNYFCCPSYDRSRSRKTSRTTSPT